MVKLPSSRETVDVFVPFTVTVAEGTAEPFPSRITPRTERDCATAEDSNSVKATVSASDSAQRSNLF